MIFSPWAPEPGRARIGGEHLVGLGDREERWLLWTRIGRPFRSSAIEADARHLRELLMVGRLPESWIAPQHLLDLRAQVRLRHTLVDARREWQQRIHAVLYHHGVPARSGLMTPASRSWLAGLDLPATAREQISIALAMIDAHDMQLIPLDQHLRAYARAKSAAARSRATMASGRLTSINDPRRARRRAPL